MPIDERGNGESEADFRKKIDTVMPLRSETLVGTKRNTDRRKRNWRDRNVDFKKKINTLVLAIGDSCRNDGEYRETKEEPVRP